MKRCTDIPDYVGIIGTPIIDPTTNTVYFFSKGYKNGAANGGVANGKRHYGVGVCGLTRTKAFTSSMLWILSPSKILLDFL